MHFGFLHMLSSFIYFALYRQRAHSYNKSFNVNNVLQGCYASFALFALRPLRLSEPFQPVDFTSITVSYISLACPSGPRAATRIRFLQCLSMAVIVLCFGRGRHFPSSPCGCVFSMPSRSLMLHNGSFIHSLRRPAGVRANQIMALSAPAY